MDGAAGRRRDQVFLRGIAQGTANPLGTLGGAVGGVDLVYPIHLFNDDHDHVDRPAPVGRLRPLELSVIAVAHRYD